jgi:hypothetical protein
MATIKTTFGSGGAGLHPGAANRAPSLATALRDIADDLETLRTAFNTLTAKLNADAGVTDTNYATMASNAIVTKKG